LPSSPDVNALSNSPDSGTPKFLFNSMPRVNSPLRRNLVASSPLASNPVTIDTQSIPRESLLSPKRSSLSPTFGLQNCHQLLHSFLASYQPLLEPLVKRYGYMDPYITILYGCVELYKVSGYLVEIIPKAAKGVGEFDPQTIQAEMLNVNVEALSLLRLLKDFLGLSSLEGPQISLLRRHLIGLTSKCTNLVKSVILDIVGLITPPSPALDYRILAGLLTQWTNINESLQDALEKVGDGIVTLPRMKRNGSASQPNSNSSSIVTVAEQFKRLNTTLLELDSCSNLGAGLKESILKSLQCCTLKDAMIFEHLLELLNFVKETKRTDLDEICVALTLEAQVLLSVLQ
jgi:hypothetical protein